MSITLATTVNLQNILDEAEIEYKSLAYVNIIKWPNSETLRDSGHYTLALTMSLLASKIFEVNASGDPPYEPLQLLR